ncbi:MAG: hypothetical protein EOO45_00510 [Flavobacterium sp.]|nr:MAG: hypothetical protein EOO45_00510 [Flavobacterium sp.]
MENVILHISDLHVTTHLGNDGRLNPKIDSYLTTNANESASNFFLEKLVEKVKEDFEGKKITLLITGDISNQAEIKEFFFAEKFIKQIMVNLDISADHCLIIPGDHDVHRRSLDNALELTPSDEPHLLNDIKFKNFADFYSQIKTRPFQFDKIIIDYLVIEEKVILLAINSNFMVNNRGGLGNIPIDRLKSEFAALKSHLCNDDLQYVACWHHNFTAGFEDTNKGQWETENRKHLLAELESLGIKLVLTGNEHTSNSKSIQNGSIMTSDCGALCSVPNDATFKVYPINIGEEIILDNRIYALQKTNGNDHPFFWQARDNVGAKQPTSFKLFVPNKEVIEDTVDLPHIEIADKIEEEVNTQPEQSRIFYDDPGNADQLYNIIRKKKLFHSGHFHWSNSSRAHNWIDVSKLLEDHEDLVFAQNSIIDIIARFNLDSDSSLIIGLGYEGNIISSKASIKYDIPYTSLPYSYRYNDHHAYEKKLNFDNVNGAYNKVIIITDVVNDGRTIRKLIDIHEKAFFTNVSEVIVVSLFYTGHENINIDILNYDRLPETYNRESDYNVNKISFYTVKSLKVEKCPYGENYKSECFIYKDELSCVHLFYDELKEDNQ